MMNHALRSRRETIALQSKRFIAALCFMSFFALSFILAAIGKQPATANPKAQVENTDLSNSDAALEGTGPTETTQSTSSNETDTSTSIDETTTQPTGAASNQAQTTSKNWSATTVASQTTAKSATATTAAQTTKAPTTAAPTTTQPVTTTTASSGS